MTIECVCNTDMLALTQNTGSPRYDSTEYRYALPTQHRLTEEIAWTNGEIERRAEYEGGTNAGERAGVRGTGSG